MEKTLRLFVLIFTPFLWTCLEEGNRDIDHTNTASPNILYKMVVVDSSIEYSKLSLTVRGPGMDTIRKDFAVVNRVVDDSLEIPIGENRVFIAHVFDILNKIVFSGTTMVDIEFELDFQPQIEINLIPKDPGLWISPTVIVPDSIGQQFTVEVMAFNIQNIFSAVFELAYDTANIEIADSNIVSVVSISPLITQGFRIKA